MAAVLVFKKADQATALATLWFDGQGIACQPVDDDGQTFKILVPRGYRRPPAHVLCEVFNPQRSPSTRLKWELHPLPDSSVYVRSSSASSEFSARHIKLQNSDAVKVAYIGPIRPGPAIEILATKFTYIPEPYLAGSERIAGREVIYTSPFAKDQNAVSCTVSWTMTKRAQGELALKGCRIASQGGDAYLEVPRAFSRQITSALEVTVPTQRARIYYAARNRLRLINLQAEVLHTGGAPTAPAWFGYDGPSLEDFGISGIQFSSPEDQSPTPLRALKPLKIGPVPRFKVHYIASWTEQQGFREDTVLIE